VVAAVADPNFQVPQMFAYGATLCWAASGAMVGIEKRFDAVGVFVVSLLSATGGSLMRDVVCLHRTPILLAESGYLPLILGTTAVLTLFVRPLTRVLSDRKLRSLVELVDAAGTPAFAVVGMQLAEDQGIPIVGIVFVGVVNGVGGGLLRDVVVREVPVLLRPGHFTTLFLVLSCGVFLALTRPGGITPGHAGWIVVCTFFVLRVLALRLNWQSRSVGSAP
jgi:uncharacterized membrane protein YeiH